MPKGKDKHARRKERGSSEVMLAAQPDKLVKIVEEVMRNGNGTFILYRPRTVEDLRDEILAIAPNAKVEIVTWGEPEEEKPEPPKGNGKPEDAVDKKTVHTREA